jgi:hypothetical protein
VGLGPLCGVRLSQALLIPLSHCQLAALPFFPQPPAANCPTAPMQLDTFFFSCHDVGQPQSLRIRTSSSGLGSAWHLASVTVTNMSTGASAVFPHGDWLDAAKGSASLLLYPDRDGGGRGDVGAGPALLEYTVRTYTSDIRCGLGQNELLRAWSFW